MPHRLFIAIRPPASVREPLLDAMEGIEGARWQGEDMLHVTLRFIGEVETPTANDLAAALGQIDAAPFRLHVSGVGHFERKGHPHAVWAGVSASPALETLRQKVERACDNCGLGRETRRFTPHITLARLNRSSGEIIPWLSHWTGLNLEPWTVDEFGLWESTLGAGGSSYNEVVGYRLGRSLA